MMTMNSAISVFPRTLSNLYLLRLADPRSPLAPCLRRRAEEAPCCHAPPGSRSSRFPIRAYRTCRFRRAWPSRCSLLTRFPFLRDRLLAAVEVNESPLRFVVEWTTAEVDWWSATGSAGKRRRSTSAGRRSPGATGPSRTGCRRRPLLNPFVPQRFTMLDGRFRFADGHGSGFDGFGAGRTFPLFPRGFGLRIGAVIDILRGHGRARRRRGHRGRQRRDRAAERAQPQPHGPVARSPCGADRGTVRWRRSRNDPFPTHRHLPHPARRVRPGGREPQPAARRRLGSRVARGALRLRSRLRRRTRERPAEPQPPRAGASGTASTLLVVRRQQSGPLAVQAGRLEMRLGADASLRASWSKAAVPLPTGETCCASEPLAPSPAAVASSLESTET